MTTDDAVNALLPAVKGETTAARGVAEAHLLKAVLKVGRMNGVDFNREWAEFTLESGTSSYEIGKDILSKYLGVSKVKQFWRTDVKGWPITILGMEEFNTVARGGTATGPPTVATIHSSSGTMEVYPIPDSNYTVGAYLKKKVSALSDIDESYHDVVLDYATLSIQATNDPNVAIKMVKEGLKALRFDSMVGWSGDVMPNANHLGTSDGRTKADSGNLRP